jgi:hypothetical protein
MTSAEIGNYGERHVTAALVALNYKCTRNTQQPGSTDIEARASRANLLVQVKTGLKPNQASSLSADEQRNIVSRAAKLGYEAWLAQLQINDKGELVGRIVWTQLN